MNGFGHWLGLICPDCGAGIPSLLNITSWLVLAVLSPLFWLSWWLFGKRYSTWERRRAARARQRIESRKERGG
jgi:membrane protein implicated in regulation of membrane protease activity